jgi:hypothetical protein
MNRNLRIPYILSYYFLTGKGIQKILGKTLKWKIGRSSIPLFRLVKYLDFSHLLSNTFHTHSFRKKLLTDSRISASSFTSSKDKYANTFSF